MLRGVMTQEVRQLIEKGKQLSESSWCVQPIQKKYCIIQYNPFASFPQNHHLDNC